MSQTSNKIATRAHGHRGARGIYPENTLTAIQYAVDVGCQGVEVDVCVSKDNQLVVNHDPVLSSALVRDKDENWIQDGIAVRQSDLKTLKTYDVGRLKPDSAQAQRFTNQTPVDGSRIPTIDEYISLVKESDRKVVFNIELKSAPDEMGLFPVVEEYVDLVLEALDRHNITQDTYLQSFDWRLICRAKEVCPSLLTGFLTDLQPDGSPLSPVSGKSNMWTNYRDLADFDDSIPLMISEMGADVWSNNHKDLAPNDINVAKGLGLDVYVWTVNELPDMQRMIDWGVDVVTTDYPDRLIELIKNQPSSN